MMNHKKSPGREIPTKKDTDILAEGNRELVGGADGTLVGSASSEGHALAAAVAVLSDRGRDLIRLKFAAELKPEQIQAQLGINRRRYDGELVAAMTDLAEQLPLVRARRFCEKRENALIDYAADLAKSSQAHDLSVHLAACRSCNKMLDDLNALAKAVAQATPVGPTAQARRHRPLVAASVNAPSKTRTRPVVRAAPVLARVVGPPVAPRVASVSPRASLAAAPAPLKADLPARRDQRTQPPPPPWLSREGLPLAKPARDPRDRSAERPLRRGMFKSRPNG